MSDKKTFYDDVLDFHRKFDLPTPDTTAPRNLDFDLTDFRFKFMVEELIEWRDAVARGDVVKAADALADLVYVALGTAAFQGIPFNEVWEQVQRANMAKVRTPSASASKRGSAFDVIKPPGWEGPERAITRIIDVTLAQRHPETHRRICVHCRGYVASPVHHHHYDDGAVAHQECHRDYVTKRENREVDSYGPAA